MSSNDTYASANDSPSQQTAPVKPKMLEVAKQWFQDDKVVKAMEVLAATTDDVLPNLGKT